MLQSLIRVEKQICTAGMVAAGFLLVTLVLLSGANVACRMAGHPISASYELSGLFGALLAALALADTQRKRGHVELDLFTRVYAPGARRWVGAFNVFAGAVLVAVLGGQLVSRACVLLRAGEVSETLKLPYPWLMVGAAGGLFLLAASYLTDFAVLAFGHIKKDACEQQRAQTVNPICDEPETGRGKVPAVDAQPRKWPVLGPGLVVVAAAALWAGLHFTRIAASPAALGYLGIGIMLTLILFTGMSPGLAMLLAGFIGLLALNPPATAAALLNGTVGAEVWTVFSNYGFTVIPLFVLLGEVIYHAGYSDRLFRAAQAWFGHTRGGLAVTTILACAGFSAICGSNTATAATMSSVALKPMWRNNYHPELKCGSIAAGSTLGAMIPPSIVLVVYGLYTGQSIGKLFAGSILPGVLLTALFVLSVKVTLWRHPDWARLSVRGSRRRRLALLPQVLDVAVLFGVIMAAMFSGWVTPTEAAGLGALLGIVGCLVRGRLSRRQFVNAAWATLRITAMVFLILAGATVFGRFLVLTRLPFELTDWVAQMNLAPAVILLFMMGCYLVGGCIMDALAFLLISLPLFQPLVTRMGYDLIWFGPVVCLVTTLGAITPPVGVSCFVVAGMSPDAHAAQVFRGAMRFLPAYLIVFLLLLLFPDLMVGWLAGCVK
ncbi:MAG: TRAP transporter large permease subunit [Kiritimatiellae bacterium]|nr:TRAP transporter large permease subunit [Kiritimatiellia bacterium]